eukprot:gb/GECH01013938.1/.p1 GENE.gb/GECH01013938.1/~~gb/GECH01013938.1/.p1  ORF type:complete len:176 (+),score=43.27 gb/GECH01013938.1/:1-528(+)
MQGSPFAQERESAEFVIQSSPTTGIITPTRKKKFTNPIQTKTNDSENQIRPQGKKHIDWNKTYNQNNKNRDIENHPSSRAIKGIERENQIKEKQSFLERRHKRRTLDVIDANTEKSPSTPSFRQREKQMAQVLNGVDLDKVYAERKGYKGDPEKYYKDRPLSKRKDRGAVFTKIW